MCIASALRLKSYVDEYRTTDVSWVAADGVIWASVIPHLLVSSQDVEANRIPNSVIEAAFGLACGCLPFMKPLFKHHFPSIFGTRRGDSHGVGKYHRSSTAYAMDKKLPTKNSTGSEFDTLHEGSMEAINVSTDVKVETETV